MPYELPSNVTNATTGLEDLLIYESQQVDSLIPGILLLIYLVILGSGYFSQERSKGRGNFKMWAAISGLITATLAFILFLYNGLVNIEVVIIALIISIISSFWFLLSQDF